MSPTDFVPLHKLMNSPETGSTTYYEKEATHIYDWERTRAARFGRLSVTATCTEAGELKSLVATGNLYKMEELKALIGFLQELVK